MSDIKKEELSERLYPFLQQKTKERLYGYSGKIWTDFNIHDPGVTINDILNYALTDFNFRLGYNLEDYFMSEDAEAFIPEEFGLFHPAVLRQQGIVTLDDYHQLFLENIDGLSSIEVLPAAEFAGLFNIKAHIISSVSESGYPGIEQEIRRLYYDNRNLCEELNDIQLLRVEKDENISNRYDFEPEQQKYPAQYRSIFDFKAVRNDFPAFYGVNEWGLDSGEPESRKCQAAQLKSYLSFFDKIIERGLEELGEIPVLFRLNNDISQKRRLHLFVSYLNNLDKLYGENSNPGFLNSGDITETCEEMIARRTNFIAKIPYWGRNRHKALYMNKEQNFFGLETYLKTLFGFTENEHVYIVEHIFFRDLPEPLRSKNYVPPYFPLELGLTVLLFGTSARMKPSSGIDNKDFRSGLTQFIYSKIPAHLETMILWPSGSNFLRFEQLYKNCIEKPDDDNRVGLREHIIKMRVL